MYIRAVGGFMDKELSRILVNYGGNIECDECEGCNACLDEAISAILKLFKEEMLRLIGENRESLAQLIHKHLFNADMTENSPVRNLHIYALVDDLRAELRKKVGE
jgi:hypothetical protein